MISVVPIAELNPAEKYGLEQRLLAYYSSSPATYYAIADQAGANYSADLTPYHFDLKNRVRPGMNVLELGCGSAHLCPHVEAAGGRYTGQDHGVALLQDNHARYPNARFLPIGTSLTETFDLVASLYTIEHVVDPPLYLETMWQACGPEGMLAIICPDFVDGAGLPPSFFFGTTPRRLRQKLKAMALHDISRHLIDLVWKAPRWKARARSSRPGVFWINRNPRIFQEAEYVLDADAVHLPRLRDLIWWLESRGAEILASSSSLPAVDPGVSRYNCYVLARKPA